jgi:alpha-tubulin suppressor-like RCC1 family protein
MLRAHPVRRTALLVAPALLAAAVGCREDDVSPTAPDPTADRSVVAAAVPLSFRHIGTGDLGACGVTTDNRAFCWGNSVTRPTAVATGLRFLEVRPGLQFTCGLTTGARIFCWGSNTRGQLGNGSTVESSAVPVEVKGNRRWRLLRVGQNHSCANTTSGVTFCWGGNNFGQLGDGTTTDRRAPARVSGGLELVRVSAGAAHTCGVTASHQAYCWGFNNHGQLGDGTSNQHLVPNAVKGGLAFAVIAANGTQSCGVTTGHAAYCWGTGSNGVLGYGGTDRRGRPVAVAGGLEFSGVSTGSAHSCGVTTAGRVYCWGFNGNGQVGDGTNLNQRLTPVPVASGLRFNSVLASRGAFTCGVGTDHHGYCWGTNNSGQLGDGTTQDRSVPTAVAPPS